MTPTSTSAWKAMRRVGQAQQRTRWDSDRSAIALQQGSDERESFLKELDNNLLERPSKFERFVGALDPDDGGDGTEVFSHTKALPAETRRPNFERWDLLRRRQSLQQRLGEKAAKVDAHSQEPWTAFHFRIRELGRKLRATSRRVQAQAEECMHAELQEAAQHGAKAKVCRLCVQLARKGRRYTHVAA